jgi:hypothetical protein
MVTVRTLQREVDSSSDSGQPRVVTVRALQGKRVSSDSGQSIKMTVRALQRNPASESGHPVGATVQPVLHGMRCGRRNY